VLHPLPRKHKGQGKREAANALKALLHGNEDEIILWHALDAGWSGVTGDELQVRTNFARVSLDKALQRFTSQKKLTLYDKENHRFLHADALDEIQQAVLAILAEYHRLYPLKTGMAKEELAAQLPHPVEVKLYNFVLRQLADQQQLVMEMEWVRQHSHKVDLTGDEKIIRGKIEQTYRESGLQPPFFKDVAGSLPGSPRQHQDVLEWTLSQGILIKVKEDLYFHSTVMEELQQRLVAYLKEHGEISTPDFKEMTQASRKYTIPLLEYFDVQRFTIRIGDVRRLRESRAG
jgi:selenocysteine-specific elongation factor